MARMRRGVGYCENSQCEDYVKGVFLLNHGDTFYCPRCRQLGKIENERGFYTGYSDIFKEVRVEYNFDPINNLYREIAIVRDESLWGRNNVYTLQSPLIKTEKRALKVAEAILANLNRYRGLMDGDDIPRTPRSSRSTIRSMSSSASASYRGWGERPMNDAAVPGIGLSREDGRRRGPRDPPPPSFAPGPGPSARGFPFGRSGLG
jgi:hypothetical protein